MGLIECPECNTEVSDKAEACPKCAYPIARDQGGDSSIKRFVSGVSYCKHCQRDVQPKRHIGVGTLILVLLTGFIWIIFIPFYQKRCPICKGSSLSLSGGSARPASKSTHTIEQTGKKYKLQSLFSLSMIIVGGLMFLSQFFIPAPNPRIMTWGFMICVCGIIYFVVVKSASWWPHR